MKRYIYPILLCLLTITLFTSCEEDPEVPPMTPFRSAQSIKILSNIPDGIKYSDIGSSYLFCTDKAAYFCGYPNGPINGEQAMDKVIFEYNITSGLWKIVWYITQNQINILNESGQYTKAQQLMTLSQCIGDSKIRYCCTYNGKGYLLFDSRTELGMAEFDISSNTFTFNSGSTVTYGYENFTSLFSTSKGIFGWHKQMNSLLQYSLTNKNWTKTGNISNILSETFITNPNSLLISNDKIYAYNLSSLKTFSFPYSSYDEKPISYPKDYGKYDGDIIIQDQPSYEYGYNPNFILNKKMYIKGETSYYGEMFYYEIDLSNYTVSLVFIKNNTNYNPYSYLYPLFTIDNKVYCSYESNSGLVEITM